MLRKILIRIKSTNTNAIIRFTFDQNASDGTPCLCPQKAHHEKQTHLLLPFCSDSPQLDVEHYHGISILSKEVLLTISIVFSSLVLPPKAVPFQTRPVTN